MIEKQLLAWKDGDQAARSAEAELSCSGESAADPRFAEMLTKAKALRAKADALFAAVLAALPPDRA